MYKMNGMDKYIAAALATATLAGCATTYKGLKEDIQTRNTKQQAAFTEAIANYDEDIKDIQEKQKKRTEHRLGEIEQNAKRLEDYCWNDARGVGGVIECLNDIKKYPDIYPASITAIGTLTDLFAPGATSPSGTKSEKK